MLKNIDAGSADNILKTSSIAMMPHAKAKQQNIVYTEVRTTTNAEAGGQYNELSGSKDHPHLFIHNTNKPPIALKAIDFH